jgi:hypothetical protein
MLRNFDPRWFVLRSVAAALVVVFIGSPGVAAEQAPNTLSDSEKAAGWILLFDGRSTDGWRSYAKPSISDGWKVVDGTLTRVSNGAGDIVSSDQYDAYELLIDFNIAKGGNSGIIFGVSEDEKTPWRTGPEIQVQDNQAGHDPQKAGWLYQLYKADTDATHPAGEWNTVRFVHSPKKSEVSMNGVKYYEFVQGSDDWNGRVAKSKFASMPKFGKNTKGHIALQDHGAVVAYRNIKLRKLATD